MTIKFATVMAVVSVVLAGITALMIYTTDPADGANIGAGMVGMLAIVSVAVTCFSLIVGIFFKK